MPMQVHVYEYGPNRMTWITYVIIGPSLLVQYIYLAATFGPQDHVLGLWVKYINAGSTK